MSIPQVSLASPAYINPQVKVDLTSSVSQVNQDSKKTSQTAKTDTVTISSQALQKLASDGDTQAAETKEKGAAKATETFKGAA
jgi:hypothetical protein